MTDILFFIISFMCFIYGYCYNS